jgi:acetyl esterase/lipase/short-subunit dehydrogenase
MALDPRVSLMLWIAKKTGRSFRPDMSVPAYRAAFDENNKRLGLRDPGGVEVRPLVIPASDGAQIEARLYRRGVDAGRVLPVLLYFHGGGWVIGSLDGYDGFMRYAAHAGRFAVLAVAYRLAPEHPFPRGHEDAFDAYAWLERNAPALGLDPSRIAVGGDSAGGGLAATLANFAASRGNAPPAFAFLIYPAVDATGRFPSRTQYDSDLPLTPASIEWFSNHAARDRAQRADPLFVPLDAPHPERNPPTHLLAAHYDPLLDEGRAYFERLRGAGVSATYDLRPTLPHAFVNFAGIVPEARHALAAGIEATAIALGAQPPKVAALTGAGSGIGRALALELAAHNYALALADRDEAGLTETARLVRDRAIASTHVLDVAQKAAVDAFAADVLDRYGRIDVLINNAGVALAGDVSELSVEEIAWLMDINFWGTVYGVKAFLPALERSPGATIVNVSSVYGIVAPPGQSAYAASKFAVRGFSESLREELRGRVHVVTVHPAGVKTNIARTSRVAAAADEAYHRRRAEIFERKALTQSPAKAARLIVRGILRKHDRVLIGIDALRIDAIARLFGPFGARIIANAVRGKARPAASVPAPAPAPVKNEEPASVR